MKKRVFLFIILLLLIFIIRITGLSDSLTLENLHKYRIIAENYVKNNFIMSSLLYIFAYIVVVALSIPGATVMTLAGGYFFGMFPGLFYINLSAVLGATIAFLVARYLLGEIIQQRYSEKLKFLNEELSKNGHLYLLTLRLIPLFPFFLVNILSGLTNIRLFTYVWTTAVGIFPASIVFTYAGTTIEKIKSVDDVMSKEVFISLILLGILSQIPNILKRFIKR